MYKKLQYCVKAQCVTGVDGHSQQNGGLTDSFNCDIGTKQGCSTSSKIFAIYVNDLVKYTRSFSNGGILISEDIGQLYALLFADDVSTFSDTAINLQRHIDNIEMFCKTVVYN